MTTKHHTPHANDGRFSSGVVDSLRHQLQAKGHAPDKARELAQEILHARGYIDAKGNLTARGQAREGMTRQERRKDVYARATGHKPGEIGYKGGKAFVK